MKDASHPFSDSEPRPRPPRAGEGHPRPPLEFGSRGAAPLPASPRPPAPDELPGPEEATFVDYLRGVVRRAPWIALNSIFVGGVAAVVALLLPHWYLASGSYLPAVEERSTFSVTALLREAAIPGAGLSDQVQAGDLSVALLRSRHLRAPLVETFNLDERYKMKTIEDALGELDVHSSYFVGQEGLVTVMIEDRDPKIAAEMVNHSINLLDQFNAEQRMTRGQRTRMFVERELAATESTLRAAEDSLRQYQSKTKLGPLSTEMESAVSTSAELLARKMQVEIALGMRSNVLKEGNEELRRLRSELAEIDRKLGELPALGLEHARLVRDLKVREQVYTFLRTEYEQAKIQEARDTPSLTIVDRAFPPIRRHRPQRTMIAASAAGVAAALSTLLALVLTWRDLLPADDRRRVALAAMRADIGAMFRRRRRS
jgi:tyrosine-protein kinase Etk/Wzc